MGELVDLQIAVFVDGFRVTVDDPLTHADTAQNEFAD